MAAEYCCPRLARQSIVRVHDLGNWVGAPTENMSPEHGVSCMSVQVRVHVTPDSARSDIIHSGWADGVWYPSKKEEKRPRWGRHTPLRAPTRTLPAPALPQPRRSPQALTS